MTEINLTVNGDEIHRTVDDRVHLADFLRDELRLTGTHLGCEHGACGACNVLVDGKPIRSCLMLAAQADGTTVVTVEGLDEGNPDLAQTIREAFQTNHGLQCGFCTPGMLITTLDLIKRKGGPELDEQTVRNELSGNLCRCTGYVNIVAAVLDANRKHERSEPATALGRRAKRRRSVGD
jgi:aerobic carbon-monoxide dehydrogenase small subunit